MQNIQTIEHLREKLTQLQKGRNPEAPYTVSIGAAVFPDHAAEFDELFYKADEALYRAKQEKNIYAIYTEK